jgi:rod shape-determining protein MreD
MRAFGVVGVMAASVALQMAFARFTVGGNWSLDLVLVAVAFVALKWGPGAGVVGGTIGGLTQDALAGGVIGVGGLAKTIVGFGVGVIGSQFIVARPAPRMVIVAGASIVHRLLVQAILSAINLGWIGVSWPAMLTETGLNALTALVLFQAVETVPALMRRGPSRRSNFGKRKW